MAQPESDGGKADGLKNQQSDTEATARWWGGMRAWWGGMRAKANIAPAGLKPPSWDPSDPLASINKVYAYVEDQTTRSIEWYWGNKTRRQYFSVVLRFLAILCGAIGGLIPIWSAAAIRDTTERAAFNQWGFLFIGVAAFWVAWDRYAGASTGWMRYVSTA